MSPTRTIPLAAALGSLALAATAPAAGTTTDPKGDTKGSPDSPFDLRAASVKSASGRQVHRVESWKAAGSGGVVLELKTSNVSKNPDFMVMKSRESGKTQILDHRGEKVGSATYRKLSSTAFSLAFGLAMAGNPPSYKWRWRVYGKNGTYDLLPNKGWVTRRVDYGGDDHR